MYVLLTTVARFMSRIAFCPVELLRHRMSALPSPSKPPTPTMCQFRSETVSTVEVLATLPPFMSHSWFWPVTLLCQRMSALPPPLKSATPATAQFGSVTAGVGGVRGVLSPLLTPLLSLTGPAVVH